MRSVFTVRSTGKNRALTLSGLIEEANFKWEQRKHTQAIEGAFEALR